MRAKWRYFVAFLIVLIIFSAGSVAYAAEITNVKAESINDGEEIKLTWDEANFAGESVHIWRKSFAFENPPSITSVKDGNPDWTKLPSTITAATKTYTDTALTDGNSYIYKLAAIDSAPADTGAHVSNWAASKPIATTLGGVQRLNVARGKPLETNSDGNPTTRQSWKMVDGNDHEIGTVASGHFWQGKGMTSPGSAIGGSNHVLIILDLLKTESFNAITLLPRMSDGASSPTTGWGPHSFEVYASDNYNTVAIDRPENAKIYSTTGYPQTSNNFSVYDIAVGDRSARYIGIRITATYATDNTVQIRELKVYRTPPPQLTYEIDEVSVQQDNSIDVKILYPADASDDAVAIFALYSADGKELLGADLTKFKATDGSVNVSAFADYIQSGEAGVIRGYIWNSTIDIKPLTTNLPNILTLPQQQP